MTDVKKNCRIGREGHPLQGIGHGGRFFSGHSFVQAMDDKTARAVSCVSRHSSFDCYINKVCTPQRADLEYLSLKSPLYTRSSPPRHQGQKHFQIYQHEDAIQLSLNCSPSYRMSTRCPQVRSQKKKTDIIWEFFPNVGPPPFWEPLIKKKILVLILHFRT